MTEKTAKSSPEVQLGFAFLQSAESPSSQSVSSVTPQLRAPRSGSKPSSLAEMVAAARVVLLEAPLPEVSMQLLPLFEFCEAVLTRTLDVVPTRPGMPFSPEEYRSLRGIGQAQWLLTEAHSKREAKPVARQGKKSKMVKNAKLKKAALKDSDC